MELEAHARAHKYRSEADWSRGAAGRRLCAGCASLVKRPHGMNGGERGTLVPPHETLAKPGFSPLCLSQFLYHPSAPVDQQIGGQNPCLRETPCSAIEPHNPLEHAASPQRSPHRGALQMGDIFPNPRAPELGQRGRNSSGTAKCLNCSMSTPLAPTAGSPSRFWWDLSNSRFLGGGLTNLTQAAAKQPVLTSHQN